MTPMDKLYKILREDKKNKNIKKEALFSNIFKTDQEIIELTNQLQKKIPHGDFNEIKDLIEEGAMAEDLESLANAIIYSRSDVIKMLIENGANKIVNSRIKFGMTPLTLLINNVDSNYLATFNELIQGGANPLLADGSGNTPLHYAVSRNNVELIGSLLHSYGEPLKLLEQKNRNGLTPIDLAKQKNNTQVVKYFNETIKDITPIDFFKEKIKRLKKKPTPNQYEELQQTYEDLRQQNLSGEKKDSKNLKNKLKQKMIEFGLIDEYEEDDNYN